MSKTLSLLVSWCRIKKNAVSLRKIRTASEYAFLYWCLCSGGTAIATTKTLDDEIGTLGKAVNQTSVDVEAAFQKLQDQCNATQGVLIDAPIVKAHVGDTIQWPISLVAGIFSPSALQFDITLPTGITFVSAVIGPAGTQAGKQLSSAVVGGSQRALLFGLNSTPIKSGVVTIITLKVGSQASKRLYPIYLNNAVVSDGAGNTVVNSTVSGMVIVQ